MSKLPPKQIGKVYRMHVGESDPEEFYSVCSDTAVIHRDGRRYWKSDLPRRRRNSFNARYKARKSGPWRVSLTASGMAIKAGLSGRWEFRYPQTALEFAEYALPLIVMHEGDIHSVTNPAGRIVNRSQLIAALAYMHEQLSAREKEIYEQRRRKKSCD